MDAAAVINVIEHAFAGVEHPGDPFLLGSHDGEEPLQEVSAFHGVHDWHTLSPQFLDAHYTVLSFFSEGGFRFYLPDFLIADVRDLLQTADPVFHLVHGFSDTETTHEIGDRTFKRASGGSRFINPRRYGAMVFLDYARCRLSVFAREEAGAIVAYLEFVRQLETRPADRDSIDRALAGFWRERAASAPARAEMRRFLAEEAEYVDALMRRKDPR